MKKFYYIAIKDGRPCEGIVRSGSIDEARRELDEQGMMDINLAILRSDTVDFLDLESPDTENARL